MTPEFSSTLRKRVAPRLGAVEAESVVARLEHHLADIVGPLDALYGHKADTTALVHRLLDVVGDALENRSELLRILDRRREVDTAWFQRSRMIGYVAYVDRLAGDLEGVREHLDYLGELGVTYLHLMPLLRAREGDNDGGYAVADYRSVEPALGTMTDLENLAADMHERGMSLCIDMVLNHTAAEHPWARAAVAGDPTYRSYYLTFPDRTEPDEYERTLPEVFPDFAPGNFTFVPELGWVWTTFYNFQWDLDWSNPEVFVAMLDTMLYLVNRGVDVLRLDAVPFMWKRKGSNCQNQPEVHLLLQALRGLVRIAAPGVLFKAEAIVAPEQLVQYLGGHDRHRPEADLAYNNQLMVMLWSSLAARDARLATASLSRMRAAPSETTWVTYVRCHDDIGWAVSDADAATVGWNGWHHRRFLNDFFSGRHFGSFARGALFQEEEHTGDARISGTAASLCGIEAALEAGDELALEAGIRRLMMLYSVIYAYGGIPLIYMGDEIALRNDPNWADEPRAAGDNRWMHRPYMDWTAAGHRHDPATLEGRIFAEFRRLAAARVGLLHHHAGGLTNPVDTDNKHVFGYMRRHPRSGAFLGLANFSDHRQHVGTWLLHGFALERIIHSSDAHTGIGEHDIALEPWGYLWVTEP